MSTWQGFGKSYYGKTEKRSDGSYVTTQWIVALLPIWPLNAWRVILKDDHFHSSGSKMTTTKTFHIIEQVPRNWKNIFQTILLRGVPWIAFITVVILIGVQDAASGQY